MKIINPNYQSEFVKLQGNDWLTSQRIAGKVVAATLTMLENLVLNGTDKTLLEMDKLADEYINDSGCVSTFKGYKGFPGSICISVNKTLVHGVPTDYRLQDGDVVSFDLGATKDGAIADSALTCIFGTPNKDHIRMIEACKEALAKGIAAAKVGNRINDISAAIWKSAKGNGFNVISAFGGHSLCIGNPHSQPFISNKPIDNLGIRIAKGLTIAIEPLLIPGNCKDKTYTAENGWDIITDMIGSHTEHTLYIHEDHTEIITKRESEN